MLDSHTLSNQSTETLLRKRRAFCPEQCLQAAQGFSQCLLLNSSSWKVSSVEWGSEQAPWLEEKKRNWLRGMTKSLSGAGWGWRHLKPPPLTLSPRPPSLSYPPPPLFFLFAYWNLSGKPINLQMERLKGTGKKFHSIRQVQVWDKTESPALVVTARLHSKDSC